jgi:hypothetical protein
MRTHILLAALALSVAIPATAASAQRGPSPDAGHRLFAMQSNFWVNLHHFLYVTARAERRLDRRTAVTQALADTVGIGTLSAARRADWDAALAFYRKAIAERDVLFDSALVAVNVALSHVAGTTSLASSGVDAAVAKALERAAPAYAQVWWPRHDAMNQRWIADVRRLLVQHGDSAARWESRIFGVPWERTPVPTDVVAYANWAGAYTTEHPSHITIATSIEENQATQAFELLFHEVLHTMDRPLLERLLAAAAAQGKQLPEDATHPFIFYTAGEVARQLIPGHVPYADVVGLWTRSRDFGGVRPALARHWQPWIDRRITVDEAVRGLIAEPRPER